MPTRSRPIASFTISTTFAPRPVGPTRKSAHAAGCRAQPIAITAQMATNDPMMDTGIASEITTVAPNERRNSNRINAANVPPNQMFWVTSEIADLM